MGAGGEKRERAEQEPEVIYSLADLIIGFVVGSGWSES